MVDGAVVMKEWDCPMLMRTCPARVTSHLNPLERGGYVQSPSTPPVPYPAAQLPVCQSASVVSLLRPNSTQEVPR